MELIFKYNQDKTGIIDDSVVTDQAVIDYLDDHYGRPVKWRNILF